MNSVGAVMVFWGVLLVVVGFPSLCYYFNLDDQKGRPDEITSLRFICVALGIVLLGVISGVLGCIILVPPPH